MRGVEAALSGQGEDEVGGQFAVPPGGEQVREPPVQLGCGALVGVQEQGDPGHGVRDPVELGDEHRGEDLDRFRQQPGLLLLPGPPAEHRPQPARAPRHDRRVQAAGQRPDDRYRPGRDQPGLRRGERPGRGNAGRPLVVRREPPRRLVERAPVGGEQPVERLERMPLLGELRGESGEYVRHGVGTLVGRCGQRPELPCRLPPFPQQRGLADPGVAPHMEDEPVPGVLGRQHEVGSEQTEFGLPTDEGGAAPAFDDLLEGEAAGAGRRHGISLSAAVARREPPPSAIDHRCPAAAPPGCARRAARPAGAARPASRSRRGSTACVKAPAGPALLITAPAWAACGVRGRALTPPPYTAGPAPRSSPDRARASCLLNRP
ncbi:hypothetical protein SBADM41S_06117 [Streptomyces badius]